MREILKAHYSADFVKGGGCFQNITAHSKRGTTVFIVNGIVHRCKSNCQLLDFILILDRYFTSLDLIVCSPSAGNFGLQLQ